MGGASRRKWVPSLVWGSRSERSSGPFLRFIGALRERLFEVSPADSINEEISVTQRSKLQTQGRFNRSTNQWSAILT